MRERQFLGTITIREEVDVPRSAHRIAAAAASGNKDQQAWATWALAQTLGASWSVRPDPEFRLAGEELRRLQLVQKGRGARRLQLAPAPSADQATGETREASEAAHGN